MDPRYCGTCRSAGDDDSRLGRDRVFNVEGAGPEGLLADVCEQGHVFPIENENEEGQLMDAEDKRPDPPVVAVLVPVVITMTADQAEQYVDGYGLDETDYEPGETLPASVARNLATVRDAAEAVAEALAESSWLNDGMTVTVLDAEPFPVGEPFPGSEDGYVTGLCAHRVARSEWAAGFRVCEHCHGVTVNG